MSAANPLTQASALANYLRLHSDRVPADLDALLRSLVVATVEACAEACEGLAYSHKNTAWLGSEQNCLRCAEAIRGLGKEGGQP